MTEFEFTGKDLKDRWGVKWFELIDYVRTSNGKLQPYNSYGYKIIDPCTEYGDSVFRELFPLTLAERPDLIESVSQKTPPKHVLHEKNQPEYWSLNLKAHTYYQLIEVVFRAHNCVIGDFTVPADEIKAETLILNAKGWLFKAADVLSFEKKHGLERAEEYTPNDLPESISKVEQSPNEISPDDFIKKLVLHHVSNEEINFQFGQQKHSFYLDKLGNKQRKTLNEILDNPRNIYSLGPSHDKQIYHLLLQRIKELSKKFVDFLNKEFGANIPVKHLLFKLSPEEGPSKYKPIFQVAGKRDPEKEIEKLREKTKLELIKEFKIAIKNHSEYDGDTFNCMVAVLKEKGVKEDEFNKYYEQTLRKGQVVMDLFNEHPPEPEPGMSIIGSSKKTGPPDDDEKVE